MVKEDFTQKRNVGKYRNRPCREGRAGDAGARRAAITATILVFLQVLIAAGMVSMSLPDWMRAGAQTMGVVSIGAIIVLIIAANQRERAIKMVEWALGFIPFLDTAN